MNAVTFVTLLVLSFFIQTPGCFSHREESDLPESERYALGGWSIPFCGWHQHCRITQEDRLILTYCGAGGGGSGVGTIWTI